MAPTYEHRNLLLRWGGHFGATSTQVVDTWSVGLRFGHPVSDVPYDPAKLATFLTSCAAAITILHGNTSVYAGLRCFKTWVTAARVGIDGRYDPDTQETARIDTAALPGNGSVVVPWNTAHVISLRTTRPRGRGSNGRMYYPMLTPQIDGDTGRMDPSVVLARLNAFKTAFDAFNVAANTYSAGVRIVVASGIAPGLNAVVTSIRADDRLDSQERRENAAASKWSTASLVP